MAQAGLVAGGNELLDLQRRFGGHQRAHELFDHMLGICPHETIDDLAVFHRVDRRDRLNLECLADGRVLVDVDLHQHDLAVGGVGNTLEDGSDGGAWAAPGRPQVNHHSSLHRTIDDVGLEACVGDIDGHVVQAIDARPNQRLSGGVQRPANDRPGELLSIVKRLWAATARQGRHGGRARRRLPPPWPRPTNQVAGRSTARRARSRLATPPPVCPAPAAGR